MKLTLRPGGKEGNIFDIGKDFREDIFKFFSDTISEEAVIANETEVRGKDVLNKVKDEVFGGETREGFRLAALLIEEGDRLTVVMSDPGLS